MKAALSCNSSSWIEGNLESQHKFQAFLIGKVSNNGYGHSTELLLSFQGVQVGTVNVLCIKINKGGKSSTIV